MSFRFDYRKDMLYMKILIISIWELQAELRNVPNTPTIRKLASQYHIATQGKTSRKRTRESRVERGGSNLENLSPI